MIFTILVEGAFSGPFFLQVEAGAQENTFPIWSYLERLQTFLFDPDRFQLDLILWRSWNCFS